MKTEKFSKAKLEAAKKRMRADCKILDHQEALLEAAQIPERRKLIGKCYKYHNSYGSGERWWMYMRITGLSEDGGSILCHDLQECEGGKFEIQTNTHYHGHVNGGYVEITLEEYKAGIAPVIAEFLSDIRLVVVP